MLNSFWYSACLSSQFLIWKIFCWPSRLQKLDYKYMFKSWRRKLQARMHAARYIYKEREGSHAALIKDKSRKTCSYGKRIKKKHREYSTKFLIRFITWLKYDQPYPIHLYLSFHIYIYFFTYPLQWIWPTSEFVGNSISIESTILIKRMPAKKKFMM